MNKREQFLLWTLASLLTWQAAIFSYGVHSCVSIGKEAMNDVCPQLGDRFDTYVNTSLGAILGFLAGSLSSKP